MPALSVTITSLAAIGRAANKGAGTMTTPNDTTPTLTTLEQTVLDACWQAALDSTGGDFACADEVFVPKVGRRALGGVLTSLETKRMIHMDVSFINQGITRTGRRTKGTRVVQITFPDAYRAARAAGATS